MYAKTLALYLAAGAAFVLGQTLMQRWLLGKPVIRLR